MFSILDPRAEPGIPIEPYLLSADTAKSGLRIALLSNGFPDATNLLRSVEISLSARLSSPTFTLFERFNATVLAAEDVVAEIAETCDVVVTGMGHCGSCTSSAVRDAVNLARAGVPAVALVSEKFSEPAQFVARSVGSPEIPRVSLPHPITGTGAARIQEIADSVANDIVAAWEGKSVVQ